jgi:hypothetical protein
MLYILEIDEDIPSVSIKGGTFKVLECGLYIL